MTPEQAVTRESAAAIAAGFARDPSTVVELAHPGYAADERDGGYAFVYDTGFVTIGHDGTQRRWMQPSHLPAPTEADLAARVEESWSRARHVHRPFGMDDVNAYHRVAIAAIVDGLDSVGQLPRIEREGLEVDVVDAVMIRLRSSAKEPTQEAVLRAMAENDHLVDLPGPQDRAHECGVCGRPALDGLGSHDAVCTRCESRATCPHERLLVGFNQTWAGGFVAHHRDDDSECEVTTSSHQVMVDEVACLMDERRFGGTYVRPDVRRRR